MKFLLANGYLLLEVLEVQCLYSNKQYSMLACDVNIMFANRCRNPVRKPDGWLIWGSVGFLLAPILVSIVLNIFTVAGYTVCKLLIVPPDQS